MQISPACEHFGRAAKSDGHDAEFKLPSRPTRKRAFGLHVSTLPMFSLMHIVALARDANMSTSYKPALLKALVRVSGTTAALRIPLHVIGTEYLRLYWTQTVVFRLRQAASLSKEPEIPRDIRETAARNQVRDLRDLPTDGRLSLEKRLARKLKTNVLEAFHKSAPDGMSPLFFWSGADHIDVSDDARKFMTENAGVLEALANLWWATYLEKVNLLAPLIIQKVERSGAKRSSLVRYLHLLCETDHTSCFYCNRSLRGIAVHVDHVIPWSFLLADPLWDLVLSCERCNLAKSDRLPDRSYLQKLRGVHVLRAKTKLPANFASPILHYDEVSRFYDAAVSVDWPADWSP